MRARRCLLLFVVLVATPTAAVAQSQPTTTAATVSEFYVRYKMLPSASEEAAGVERAVALSSTAGMLLVHVRTLNNGRGIVVRADRKFTREQAWTLAKKLEEAEGVAFVHAVDSDARQPAKPDLNVIRQARSAAQESAPSPGSMPMPTGDVPRGIPLGIESVGQGKLGAEAGSAQAQSAVDSNVEVPSSVQPNTRPPDPSVRNIETMTIKWKRTTLVGQAQAPTSEELERVTSAAGIKFTVLRDRGYGRIVFQLPQPISLVEAEAIAARIRALPEIEYVVPGVRGRLGATPNDTWFEPRQWNLRAGIAGINAQSAWDYVSASDPSTVVAVIDSGVLPGHEDIAGRVVTGNPAGYDFISNATIANDGDGRDANPADPGSWVSSAEAGTPPFAQCAQEDSIWHGTLVAGIIGATPNNAKGIAGIGWNARLLPVRAFGKGSLKCSTGSLEDVGDAIAWSIEHTSNPRNELAQVRIAAVLQDPRPHLIP